MRLDENGRSDNGHVYHEHTSTDAAKAEAHRLAKRLGGKMVVYLPLVIIERTPETTETPITQIGAPDEYPF